MRKFTLLFLFILVSLWTWGQCSTTANFTYVYTGCSTIQFTDASTASSNYTLVKWQWDYGDGDTATGQTVSHTFTPGITVNVKLVVTADSSGVTCTDSITKTIVVHSLPTVYAASDHNPSCIVIPAQFFGSSGMEPYINSWQWDFGDGTYDTAQNPTHLYSDTGSYRVILHVVDSNECENNDTIIQKINPIPAMGFTWSVEPAATTDNIQFTATVDTSIGPVTSWHWDFGDGDTSNIQNPTHQYSTTGQYNVTLSVIVGGFCPNSLTQTVHVDPLPAPDFSVSPVCLNDTTFFTDLSTTPVGTITTWKWYFGDGDSLIINSPRNPNVKHIYTIKTTYPVTLLTINSDGYKRSITKNITVVPKPLADFTFNDTCYTLPTTFTDQSSLEGGSAITSWNWNFCDTLSGAADSSVLQNPTHIFSLPGTYPVQLIIRNADGCSDTTIKSVVRDTLPTVEFTISKDSVCPGEIVSFYGLANDISTWHWDFGNGDTSQYQNPTYHYSSSGTYTVTLTVTNTNGCTSSVSHTIYVKPQPLTNFTFNIWCQGDTTCFWDQSSVPNGYITEWNWNFGDGDTSTLQNPEHLYQPVGQYYATLSVTSNEGCSSSATRIIIFDSLPSPNFSVSPACMNDTTYFTDSTTTPVGVITTWKWYFGDGDSLIVHTPDSANAKHIYLAQTTYNVTLLTISSFGFERSITKQITVHHKPLANFTFNDTCYYKPISFTDSSSEDGGSALSKWNWNFGDPLSGIYNESSLQNPTHIMSHPDTFNVRLIVTNLDRCTDTAIRKVITDSVVPPVSFTLSKDSVCFGENIFFYGTGKDIISWKWDFGNGDSSAYQNPVYKYPAPGLYTVTLHTISLYGCESAISRNVFVIALPKADFSVARSCIGDSTLFSDKTSCPTGYLTQWQWDFGDTLSGSADSSSLQNPAHRFTAINGYKVQLITMSNFGCSDTVFHYVNVYDKPHPGFIYHQSCDPTTEVQFTDTSVQSSSKSPIVSYQWNFFQSDSSYLQNPVYRFPVFDSCYQVTLMVTDTNNCSNTDTVTVCLHDSLKVDFTTLNDSVCFGEDVFFYGTGKDIVSWKWDFGNGDSSVYQNPVYKYPAPGLYTVTLHTTSLYRCETVISHNVFVIASPKADFSIARSCIGDSTLFSDKTTCPAGYLTKWQWNFGDTLSGSADSSSLQNPGHRFTAINTYKTRLIATNNFGCSDTVFHYVNVYDKPHPGFIYHQSCDPATEVHFTDTSARSSSKSPIISYQWNFFQSDSSYLQNPVYRFPDFDSCYRVSLTVTDTNGCTNTDIVTVCLRDSLQINFTAPKACFNQRTFFNASYTPTLDSIAQYTWNFNDGSKEITTFHDTISHRFPHPGTYQVILSATDTNGCSIAISHEAIVDSLPTPNFVFTTPSCDQPTYFVDSSQGNGNFISTWKWNFGDVASGTENYSDLQNPNHLYVSHDSIYQVKLIVTNFNGCTDSIIKPVQRYTCMKVLFTTSSSTECANNPLYFNDLTTLHSTQGNITKWTWDFGDGNIISYDTHKDSILHIYQESGHYNVTLKVDASINNMPFSNQYDSTIIIFNPPIANFVSSHACSSRTVYFTDSTQSGDASLTQWNWTFNDPYASENSSALQNPEHIYDSAGTYPTQLIVTDQHNCHDTISKPVVVHPTPKASFDMTTNANGVTGQVLMHNTSTGASTYFWNFGDGGTSTEENPLYQYSSVGIFHILLIATSQYQCSDSATTTYDLTSGLYVPNSFAPNSNTPSTNIFLPKGVHLKEYQIQIFSSWGNLLWESNKLTPNGEPAEGWDGTYKGKPMPAGTYIWRIKAKFLNGQIWQGSDNGDGHIKPYGTLTLIR